MTSVSRNGDAFSPRSRSVQLDLGTMPYGRSRKLSRLPTSPNLTPTNMMTSPNFEPVKRHSLKLPKKYSSFSLTSSRAGTENGRHVSESSNRSLAPLPEQRNMNLTDVLIWQRLTRRLRQRVADRRAERRTFCWLDRSSSRSNDNQDTPQTQYEPTYRMQPSLKLPEGKCECLVKAYLEETLKNVAYDLDECRKLSIEMSDEIKAKIKSEILPPRYKCVVHIVLGEKLDQSVSVSSESAWDKNTDSYVSVSYQNSTLFCVATVFAVYME